MHSAAFGRDTILGESCSGEEAGAREGMPRRRQGAPRHGASVLLGRKRRGANFTEKQLERDMLNRSPAAEWGVRRRTGGELDAEHAHLVAVGAKCLRGEGGRWLCVSLPLQCACYPTGTPYAAPAAKGCAHAARHLTEGHPRRFWAKLEATLAPLPHDELQARG